MTDTVKLAKDRMALLEAEVDFFQAEIGRLKEYIRISEQLVGDGWLGPAPKRASNGGAAPRPSQTAAAQAASAAIQRNDLAKGGGEASQRASAEPTVASAGNSNETDPDCKNLFRRWNV